MKVYVDYEIPYFIVSAGNCLTKEEAIMLKGRVSATFPKAFLKQLKREKSPISTFWTNKSPVSKNNSFFFAFPGRIFNFAALRNN